MYAFTIFFVFENFHFLHSEKIWDKGIKLMADDKSNNEEFGRSVAVNDKYIVVGNPYDTVDGKFNVGSAHVFSINETVVKWEKKLVPCDPTGREFCAKSVSLNNRFIVFGCSSSYYNKGRVFVYRYDKTKWTWDQLTADDASNNDLFGLSVSISSNDELVVGASGYENNRGSVYVFSFYINKWTQVRKLVPCDVSAPSYNNEFGRYVSISNSYIAVYSNWNETGAVYVYKKKDSTWILHKKIVSLQRKERRTLSAVLSINENRLVVAAKEYKKTNRPSKPFWEYEVVYVYVTDGKTWTLEAKLDASNGYNGSSFAFGISISIGNDLIVVGASEYGENKCCYGTAYLFSLSNEKWKNIGRFTAADVAYGDRFGRSVGMSLSDKHVVVGSSRVGEDGAVYFFPINMAQIPMDPPYSQTTRQTTTKTTKTTTTEASTKGATRAAATTTKKTTTTASTATATISATTATTTAAITTTTTTTTTSTTTKKDTDTTTIKTVTKPQQLRSGQTKVETKTVAMILVTSYFILFLILLA